MSHQHTTTRALSTLVTLLLGCVLAGCNNPYANAAPPSAQTPGVSVQNAGEPPAPSPSTPSSQAPAAVQHTAKHAILQFAHLYANWTYQTLTRDQLALAAMSVDAARLAERQAAAASRTDNTIERAHLVNRGEILGVSEDLAQPGWWTLITREQTSGGGEYEGLTATDHVMLVKLATVPGGWVVSQWLPQS
jgi:hypothetical protein